MINWKSVLESIDVEKHYTVKDVAVLGIPSHSLYVSMSKGLIGKSKVFGKTYISGVELKKYIENCLNNA